MTERSIQAIDDELLDGLLAQARHSPRKRAIHCLHAGAWEHAHRMLNALTPGTYVCPHRHSDPYKGEGFILLRGELAVLIFADDGTFQPAASRILTAAKGCLGMEIPPGIWHSLVALADTVIYEVKGQPAGGYVQDSDKDFAPWAPVEGASAAPQYLNVMESLAQQLKANAGQD